MSKAHLKLAIKAMRKKEFYSIEKISQGKTLSQYYTILAVLVGKKKDRGGVRKKFKDQVKLTAEVKKYVRKAMASALPFSMDSIFGATNLFY